MTDARSDSRRYTVVGEADGAASGPEAVGCLALEAVVLDVRLPDGNGFDVCRVLNRSNPALALLLVSADDQRHRVDHIRACGARGFQLKSRLGSSDPVDLLKRARSGDHPHG